ncbi:MAG TPA: SUF system NifU family Fe-S cluster assembly protein [Gemmatimonadales bacterium]|jgi:nitrogen fixation NifU-like protein|nr:SUF system NifU family Fe-S cluster assembly protein [Gemmatimonadales bacterium]
MSSELDELYQSVILDHNRTPRNFHRLEDATTHAEGRNPLCGDMYEIWLKLEGDRVSDAAFLGQGCAISKASASMMTQIIKGKSVAEVEGLFEKFHELVTVGASGGSGLPPKLEVFKGVRAFPIRVKCATLSWHAMKQALEAVRGNQSGER